MKILVTGATGLIGKMLCKELLREGHELVVVGRDANEKFSETFTLPCQYSTWNDLDVSGVEGVFHLAGESIASGRWTAKKKSSILNSRVQTTEKLVTAFKGRWPKFFVGASAIGYYGNRGDERLIESSAMGEGFLPRVCEAWEGAAQPFEANGRVVHLRIGIVLDAKGGFLPPMEELYSNGLGGRIGGGHQWMSWIHSQDLVRLFVFAMKNNLEGKFNAVSSSPVTNSTWSKIYAQQLGVKAIVSAPRLMLKLVLGEMSQLATDSQMVTNEKIKYAGFEFLFDNLESALRDLYSWKKNPNDRIFTSEQWVSASKEKVFPFFTDAKNLELITPPWLNFKVLKQSSAEIESGTLIDYKISLRGLPLKWRTEIKEWSPPHQFVDEQLAGPYSKWHHTHSFVRYPAGTLMQDRVVYQLPMGQLGQLIAGRYVKGDIAKIFSYRSKVIDQLKVKWESEPEA